MGLLGKFLTTVTAAAEAYNQASGRKGPAMRHGWCAVRATIRGNAAAAQEKYLVPPQIAHGWRECLDAVTKNLISPAWIQSPGVAPDALKTLPFRLSQRGCR